MSMENPEQKFSNIDLERHESTFPAMGEMTDVAYQISEMLKGDAGEAQQEMDLDKITEGDIEKITDPEELKKLLLATLQKADELQARLDTLEMGGTQTEKGIVGQKRDRLAEIRFGLTETNERMERPYLISSGLANVKAALEILAMKGQMNSVILEGEPGTGKTQWAYSEVGQELQEGKDSMLIHVRVKETMRSQDLLYTVDNIQRLSDAQTSQIPEEVCTEAAVWKEKILRGEIDPRTDEDYKRFSGKLDAMKELGESSKDLDYRNYVQLGPLGEAIVQSSKGKKVWLLIDEIEKGREELMTGMLDEIENLNFTITETGETVKGDKENMRIVITTNTEESDKIPSSFRRRSLYHYLDYPTQEEMAEIVKLNFPNLQESLLGYALETFYAMHDDDGLRKKPSTPELLSWIQLIQAELPEGVPEGEGIPYSEALLKYNDDREYFEAAEKLRKNTTRVWEQSTPEVKYRYISHYEDPDSETAEELAASVGLSKQDFLEAINSLRTDERLKAWEETEEYAWLWHDEEEAKDNQDDDEDAWGDEDNDGNEDNY